MWCEILSQKVGQPEQKIYRGKSLDIPDQQRGDNITCCGVAHIDSVFQGTKGGGDTFGVRTSSMSTN